MSDSERKELRSFLRSPYFGNFNKAIMLYEYLIKIEDLKSPKLESKKVEKIIQKKSGKTNKLSAYMTQLVKAIELFWTINDFQKNEGKFQLQKVESFYAREIQEKLPSEFGEQFQTYQQSPENTYQQLQLSLLEHEVIEAEGDKQVDPNLHDVYHQLNGFLLLNLFKYGHKGKYIKQILKVDHTYDFTIINHISKLVEENPLLIETYPIIVQIYYHAYHNLIKNGDKSAWHYEQFVQLAKANIDQISTEDKQTIFNFACNYQIYKANHAKGEARKLGLIESEAHKSHIIALRDLFRYQLDNNFLPMTTSSLMNMTITELDKTIAPNDPNKLDPYFTQNARRTLKEVDSKISLMTYNICLSLILTVEKKFSEIIDLLDFDDFKDPSFKEKKNIDLVILIRFTIIKSKFELWLKDGKYHNDLLTDISSLKQYVLREDMIHTKSLEERRPFFVNLCNLMTDLYKIRMDANIDKLTAFKNLEAKFSQMENVYYRPWIRSKIQEQIKTFEGKKK